MGESVQNVRNNDAEGMRALDHFNQYLKDCRYGLINDMPLRFDLGMERKKLKKELEQTNRMYNMAVLMCVFQPLNHHADKSSVLKSIGFYTACCLFSKTFREDLKSAACDLLCPMLEQKAAEQPYSVWANRKRRVERADAKGRLLMIPDVLAMLRVSLCKCAYADMRSGKSLPQDVLSDFRDMEEYIYAIALENGVNRDVLDAYTRHITRELLERNPLDVKYFEELSYGDVSLDVNGIYQYRNGYEFPYAFTPRRPETRSAMCVRLSKAWDEIMDGCLSIDAVHDAVLSEKAMTMHSKFLAYMTDDDVSCLSSLQMDAVLSEDMCWMTDYQGPDPFYEDGMLQSLDDYMTHGPQHVDKFVLDDAPEFKASLGRWLNQHTGYSPAAIQRKINDLYLNAEDKESMRDMVRKLSVCRDKTIDKLQRLAADVFHYGLVGMSCDGLSETVLDKRMNMIAKSFGHLAQGVDNTLDDDAQATITVPDFLL